MSNMTDLLVYSDIIAKLEKIKKDLEDEMKTSSLKNQLHIPWNRLQQEIEQLIAKYENLCDEHWLYLEKIGVSQV